MDSEATALAYFSICMCNVWKSNAAGRDLFDTLLIWATNESDGIPLADWLISTLTVVFKS